MFRQLPPAADLWEQLAYNPITGDLWRIARKRGPYRRVFPLEKPVKVGRLDQWGYLRCDLNGLGNVCLHRLVWAWVTGQDPGELEIDHKNRVKTDNRFHNLRLATGAQNCHNTGKPDRGTPPASPHKGVTYVRDRNGKLAYVIARITVNGERIYLGSYPTEELAQAAYQAAALKFHKSFACF